MSNTDWDHYEIPLAYPPSRPSAAAAQRPVARVLASRTARLLAVLLDLFVILLPIATVFLLTQNSADSPETRTLRLSVWIAGTLAIVILQWILLSVRGQTVGKIAEGVQIIDNDDGSNPGFMKAVVRRSLVPVLIAAVPCLGAIFVLADLLFIFGEDRRCLHDLIGGTKVVDV